MWKKYVMTCELCILADKTFVYIENDAFIVMNCNSCLVPMIVWKDHTMSIPEPDVNIMEIFLTECAEQFYGDTPFFIDKKQRSILDHLHWHARKVE